MNVVKLSLVLNILSVLTNPSALLYVQCKGLF